MERATERIPVLMTPGEKAEIARRAQESGLSMGEFMRRAAAGYRAEEDEAAFEVLIGQVLESAERANRALDVALENIEASERRIETMEAAARAARRNR